MRMKELAYLFSCNLQQSLKEVIFGGIFSRWHEDTDTLEITIESKSIVYKDRIECFTDKVLNGLTSEDVSRMTVNKFRRKVIDDAIYSHFIVQKEESPV